MQKDFSEKNKCQTNDPAKTVYICDNCEPDARNPSKFYCKDCKINFCQSCDYSVHQIRAFKDHIKCSPQQGSLEKLRYCITHKNNPLTNYCETCIELLCDLCQKNDKHVSHSNSTLFEWEKNAVSNPDMTEFPKITYSMKSNVTTMKKSLENLEGMFDKLQNEMQKSKISLFEFYQREIEKEENSLTFFENFQNCGTNIQEDSFFIRYSQTLNSRSMLSRKYCENIYRNSELELNKLISSLGNSLSIKNLNINSGVFIETEHVFNKNLILLNEARTLKMGSKQNLWCACFVDVRQIFKIRFHIDKTVNSKIMIGITEKNQQAFQNNNFNENNDNDCGKNIFTQDVVNGRFSLINAFSLNNTIQNSISSPQNQILHQVLPKGLLGARNEIKLPTIYSNFRSCAYFGNNTGQIYYGGKNTQLSEGFKTGDLLEVVYNNKINEIYFYKNERMVYKEIIKFQNPCPFVELYDYDDTVSII